MQNRKLELITVPGLPEIRAGDNPGGLIIDALTQSRLELVNGDVVVVAQKLISKAEGMQRKLSEVKPGPAAIELATAAEKEPAMAQLIIDESQEIMRHRPGVIISRHNLGMVLANAGIDRSNVEQDRDIVLLFPLNPDRSAQQLKSQIDIHFGIKAGVVIADSVGRAWRMGTTGMAIGSAGVEALANLRGQRDRFGRELEVSEHAIADSIASAAELIMGEAGEGTPVVIVRGLTQGHSKQNSTVLLRTAVDDMFT